MAQGTDRLLRNCPYAQRGKHLSGYGRSMLRLLIAVARLFRPGPRPNCYNRCGNPVTEESERAGLSVSTRCCSPECVAESREWLMFAP